MSTPQQTTILIVGAGPAGMACALSLVEHGVRDIVIVDSKAEGDYTSRASVVHAATLEAMEAIHCTDEMAAKGIPAPYMNIYNGNRLLIQSDFASLAKDTRYPYTLILPQNMTEEILSKRVKDAGIQVIRPAKVASLHENSKASGRAEVVLDNGKTIVAKYLIGADGSHSTVRDLAGIGFRDPEGEKLDMHKNKLGQMLFADVLFSDTAHLPTNTATGNATAEGFHISFPLPEVRGGRRVYRVGGGVPEGEGDIPHAPGIEYIQKHLDRFGPPFMSSDPRVNPHPIKITETVYSSRFRTRAACADTPFKRIDGGVPVMLIGDAAHIHSPAGGQGMNLGLRDAIALGAALSSHLKTPDDDTILTDWARNRHARAERVIAFTKMLLGSLGSSGSLLPAWLARWVWWVPVSSVAVRDALLVVANQFQFVRTMGARRASGIDDR